jgi:hypothetical protein
MACSRDSIIFDTEREREREREREKRVISYDMYFLFSK